MSIHRRNAMNDARKVESRAPAEAPSGVSWQFRILIGIICFGVLAVVLRAFGLF